MKFSYNIYSQSSDSILAIADLELLGKTFEEGELILSVSDFYRGQKCDHKKIVDLLKSATIINAVGKDIIGLLEKENMVNKNSILRIEGVPHAQVVVM
jgi:uncharacterized protein